MLSNRNENKESKVNDKKLLTPEAKEPPKTRANIEITQTVAKSILKLYNQSAN